MPTPRTMALLRTQVREFIQEGAPVGVARVIIERRTEVPVTIHRTSACYRQEGVTSKFFKKLAKRPTRVVGSFQSCRVPRPQQSVNPSLSGWAPCPFRRAMKRAAERHAHGRPVSGEHRSRLAVPKSHVPNGTMKVACRAPCVPTSITHIEAPLPTASEIGLDQSESWAILGA